MLLKKLSKGSAKTMTIMWHGGGKSCYLSHSQKALLRIDPDNPKDPAPWRWR